MQPQPFSASHPPLHSSDHALTKELVLCTLGAVSSTLLNKPYDAFADEGADEEVVVETKSKKQQQCA